MDLVGQESSVDGCHLKDACVIPPANVLQERMSALLVKRQYRWFVLLQGFSNDINESRRFDRELSDLIDDDDLSGSTRTSGVRWDSVFASLMAGMATDSSDSTSMP